MKSYDSSIDVLKAIAILGVVGIHSLGFLEQSDTLRINWNSYIVIDQLLRFCVPLFVGLSGFTLAKRYIYGQVDWKEFFVKRIRRTLPLYFLWSGVFVLLAFLIPQWNGFLVGAKWWQVVLLGRADYHLYFVPMIMTLYLLFPILLWLTSKFRWIFLIALFAAQMGFYFWIGSHVERIMDVKPFFSDQEQYIFFGSWIWFFALGTCLGVVSPPPGGWSFLKRLGWAGILGRFGKVGMLEVLGVLGVLGAVWAVGNAQNLFRHGVDVLVATRFTRIPVLIYCTGFLSLAILGRAALLKLPRVVLAIGGFLGRQSFLIYLCHTLWLRVGFELLSGKMEVSTLLLVVLVGVAGMGASFLVEKTY